MKYYIYKILYFIRKESLTQVFSCEFEKFLRTPIFTEQLRWLSLKEINGHNEHNEL